MDIFSFYIYVRFYFLTNIFSFFCYILPCIFSLFCYILLCIFSLFNNVSKQKFTIMLYSFFQK